MVKPSAAAHRQFSLRWKVTLPFMLLALAVGLGFVYLLARFLGQTSDERFVRQLADSGQQAADGVVRSENDLLRLERQIANTDGVGEAAANGDAEAVHTLVLPLVLNARYGGTVNLTNIHSRDTIDYYG